MNYTDLRTELIEEFYYYLNKKGTTGMMDILDEYYFARGCNYASYASDSEGTKIIISTDTTVGLTEKIQKLIFFADHIIIRHKTLLPQYMDDELNPKRKESKNRNAQFSPLVSKSTDSSLPYFCSCPESTKIKGFLKWLGAEGKNWVESGLVTYVPVMFPEDFDFVCYDKEININNLFRDSGLLPNASSRLNITTANAIKKINFPYLANVSPDTIREIISYNKESLINFQNTLLNSFSNIKHEDIDEFNRDIDYIYHDVIESGIRTINNEMKKAITVQSLQNKNTLLTTGLIGLAFYVGAPPAAVVASLAKPVYDIYQSRIKRFEAMENVKNNPMYVFTYLDQQS